MGARVDARARRMGYPAALHAPPPGRAQGGFVSSYWTYYLVWIFAAFALHHPEFLVGAVVFFLLRRWIPDPWTWLRTAGRIASLKTDVAANAANVTARRDLAMIYLDRRRPGAALRLLDEARRLQPDDAELLYLTGLARLRRGDAEGALDPLVEAANRAPKLRYGAPFLHAGETLARLGRLDDAEDALGRYLKQNGSSMEGYARMAMVRRERGDREGARRAIREGLDTWRQIPRHLRRKQWRWWLRTQLLAVGL
jgi:tetratricopeptide (TPR) repeat protein